MESDHEEIGEIQNQALVNNQRLERVKREKHKTRLHKYTGALLANNEQFGDDIIKGSGILISPDLVLTCAHNVWH